MSRPQPVPSIRQILSVILVATALQLGALGSNTAAASAPFYQPQDESGPYDTSDPETNPVSLWNKLLFFGACGAISMPYWGPYILLHEEYPGATSGELFKPYPYAPVDFYDDDCNGYMVESFANSDCGESYGIKMWSLRLDCDYGDQIRTTQNRISTHLLFETSFRLGIDAQYDWLHRFDYYQPDESMSLGDWNLTFRFAESPRWQFRSGIGMNWSADTTQGDVGFNFTYGVDCYPIRPLVISNTIDWGTLGHDELFRYRGTAGIIINRFECFTGYEYLDLDRQQSNYLLGGVRVWF